MNLVILRLGCNLYFPPAGTSAYFIHSSMFYTVKVTKPWSTTKGVCNLKASNLATQLPQEV